jgi:uncharacterized protein (TIGR00288 family)
MSLKRLKVGLFIDGPNQFNSFFLKDKSIDFKKLRDYCRSEFGELITARYYSPAVPKKFQEMLIAEGYEVIVTETDVDVPMTVDIVSYVYQKKINVLVMITSNGSFYSLFEFNRRKGVRTIIIHDPNMPGFSILLKGQAKRGTIEIRDINQLDLFSKSPAIFG